jgi:DnaK suppressor protein
MLKKDLEKFKKLLMAKQKALLDSVQESESSGREVDEDPSDIADVASSAYNKEFYFNKSNADRSTLRLIQEALARIERGRFGRCGACGIPIEPKRLQAVPWAKYCIGCQEKKEKGTLRE